MNLNDFLEDLESHREIEFHLYEKHYFLQPDWDNCKTFTIYNLYECSSNITQKLFSGTIDELINYKFDNNFSLLIHFDYFIIDYIL